MYHIDYYSYIRFKSYGDTMTDFKNIEQRIAEGKKIQAIKLYREQMKTGLKEAKEAVDHFELTGSWAPISPKNNIEHDNEIESLIRQGKIIGAIKLYREQTGKSLPEAKDFIENLDVYKELRLKPSNIEETSSTENEEQNTDIDQEDSNLERLNEQSVNSTSSKNTSSSTGLFLGILLFLILGVAAFLFSSGNV